jgi:hypothetical protein
VNVELIEKGFKLAKAHPEQHSQESWVAETPCGTRMCLAGWIAVADGWNVSSDGFAWKPDKVTKFVAFVAEQAAELSENQATELFVMSADDDMPALEQRWARMKGDAE